MTMKAPERHQRHRKVIRVEGNGLPGRTKIFLGEMEISRFVQSIQITLSNGAPRVVLHCVGEVDLPHELEAIVYGEQQGEVYGEPEL